MSESEVIMEKTSIIGSLSSTIGTTEPALRLLLSLFAAYPVALIFRKFFYGKPAILQHLFLFFSGFTIGYLNYGMEIFHSAFAVVFSYLTLVLFRGTTTCVAITFVFNMCYLLIGYYYSSTSDYDINWTLPQCVLVLRLIGLSYDLHDGTQPEKDISATTKLLVLKTRPTFLEYCAHMFFPSSFLVGPQFPMRRFQDFVAGEFGDTNDKQKPPETCIPAALKRLGLGVFYLVVFQVIGLFITDDYIISEEFGQQGFIKRCFLIGVWGRISLYKYISCWLLTEGACIMFGLSHNGKDSSGNVKWDGLANIDIWKLENATEFNHYIQSFNTNTNHWVAQYIYKRLKFMGNRFISQGATLVFLAVWHGFHSGYYICFFFEFMVMFMEKDIHDVTKKYPHIKEFFSKSPVNTIYYILQRIYTFVFMGWCLIPFVLLTWDKYWVAYSNVSYIGIIFFLPWGLCYGYIFREIAKMTKPKERIE